MTTSMLLLICDNLMFYFLDEVVNPDYAHPTTEKKRYEEGNDFHSKLFPSCHQY